MSNAAQLGEWVGENVTVSEIERELSRLRAESDGELRLRTSVMTHMAWVPQRWVEAATETLAGLAERHPSRTLVLIPDGCAREDELDARIELRRFPLEGTRRCVSTEVIELRLSGRRAKVPASIVNPLLIPDLPVFLRWRGEPPFDATEFDQLSRVADRLVIDSEEWDALPEAYGELAAVFDRVAVSDIAWSRTLDWRRALAGLWPGIAEIRRLRVASPPAEALLLAGWLRSRLRRDVELVHDDADELELVAVDEEPLRVAATDLSPSDLLSNELDTYGRDPIYEQAVRAA